MKSVFCGQQLEISFKSTKRMTLKKAQKLNKILVGIARKIYEIDYGGCGIFADYLYNIIQKSGYKCKVVGLCSFTSRTRKQHLDNLNHMARKEDEKVFAYNHICLLIGNYYFDCTNFEPKAKGKVFRSVYDKLGEIPIELLQYLNSLDWKWNELYDRRQNRRLRQMLTESLQHF